MIGLLIYIRLLHRSKTTANDRSFESILDYYTGPQPNDRSFCIYIDYFTGPGAAGLRGVGTYHWEPHKSSCRLVVFGSWQSPRMGGLNHSTLLVVAYCLKIEALRGGALNTVVESKTSANGLLPAFAVLCSATLPTASPRQFSYVPPSPSSTPERTKKKERNTKERRKKKENNIITKEKKKK